MAQLRLRFIREIDCRMGLSRTGIGKRSLMCNAYQQHFVWHFEFGVGGRTAFFENAPRAEFNDNGHLNINLTLRMACQVDFDSELAIVAWGSIPHHFACKVCLHSQARPWTRPQGYNMF